MNSQLGKLQKVEIRKVWAKEDAHFTPWLAQNENMSILGEELNMEIEVLAQEEYVGPFRADILARDMDDRYIIIENQFGKTDHSHLGQIITYASGLSATTVIWISEKFTEEHRSALDWLNSITDETVHFFGIEIELFRIGDSAPAPKFNIVSKPNDWNKTVKRKTSEVGLTETKLIQKEYWQQLKELVEKQKVAFRLQKPAPQHWTNVSIGRSDYKISVIINSQKKWIGLQLTITGNKALENFQKLRGHYENDSKIHLNENIEWLEKDGKKEHHVNLIFGNIDPLKKDDWKNQHTILKEWIEKYYFYFKDKIKNI